MDRRMDALGGRRDTIRATVAKVDAKADRINARVDLDRIDRVAGRVDVPERHTDRLDPRFDGIEPVRRGVRGTETSQQRRIASPERRPREEGRA